MHHLEYKSQSNRVYFKVGMTLVEMLEQTDLSGPWFWFVELRSKPLWLRYNKVSLKTSHVTRLSMPKRHLDQIQNHFIKFSQSVH